MKNKLSFRPLSRWVFAPLLVGSLVAWGVSPVYPGNNSAAKENYSTLKPVAGTASADAESDANSDIQEIKDRIKELESKERQSYLLVLEGQRKTMDWWFSFLAVLTAIMAIFGALIPFLMARKDKEIIEQDKRAIEQDKVQIRSLLGEVKGIKDEAEGHLEKTRQNSAKSEEILEAVQSGTPSATGKKVDKAVEDVRRDKNADFLLRLRAEAVFASKLDSAEKAYKLWAALAELLERDVSALINAGYWALQLGKLAQGDEKLWWLRQAGEKYRQALVIKPDKHDAANNWGNALAEEANALSNIDLEVARRLWGQAEEKYRQALVIQPDGHVSADNWGHMLLLEASAIAEMAPEESKRLLVKAEQLLLQHAEAAPGMVAYNLACVYGVRGDIQSCLHWLREAQEHKTLESCEHIRTDKDLDPVRDDPEFIAWLQQACPQQEAAATQDKKA